MATARAILIAGWLLLVWGGVAAGSERCLDCHPAHYESDGTCVGCHRGDPDAVRVELAHHRLLRGVTAAWGLAEVAVAARGEVLRDSLACRRCHQSGGRGEHLASNLDAVVWLREQDDLRLSLLHPAFGMPNFQLAENQIDTLLAVLLRDGQRYPASDRYQVRFSRTSADSLAVFGRLCGECHLVLGLRGPEGSGTDGPNLSGLLGAYYLAGAEPRWNSERLAQWLDNPRALRPGTTMMPVAVAPEELAAIVKTLTPQ